MEITKPRIGTTRRLNRRKKHLPIVSLETIQSVIAEMQIDKDRVFSDMAIGNPVLYRFVYNLYQTDHATKDIMLGVVIGVYTMLEKELQNNGKH